MLAQEDRAGRAWCKAHGYGGYTSYASLEDLPARATVFADLKRRLDRHVSAFADACAFDLGPKGRLKLDSLWVNVLKPGAAHSGHVHPHSVVSGTVYVATPPGGGRAAARGSPGAPDDGRPASPGRRARGEPHLRHPDAGDRRALSVGKLAAPRGGRECGPLAAHQSQLQLRLALIAQTRRRTTAW